MHPHPHSHPLRVPFLLSLPLLISALPDLTPRAIGSSCSTPYGTGTCQTTTTCSTTGFNLAGYCPNDPSNVQCCVVASCSTAQGNGKCLLTSDACSGGTFVAGACPGPSDVQCCVASSSPPPSGSGVPGVDISSSQSSSFYSCAKGQGIQRVAVRGYMQACGAGGEVDTNVVGSYKAAKAAGIAGFDAYLYPCTGSQPTGVTCKSISTQISEFLAAIDDNSISVGHYWLDIEPTNANDPGVACNSWQLGASGNLALAKQWVAAIKGTGRNWGIYANAGQWTDMFASKSTDVGSDLPLWAVQDDGKPGVSTTTAFMGGWTKAYAKQYNLDTTLCGGSVDLDSFTS